MAYELSGPVGAPVVCLNHCFGSDLHYWDRHLAAFEGFRVLRHDTRGHGGSDAPTRAVPPGRCWPPTWRGSRMRSVSSGCTSAGCRSGGRSRRPCALDYPERVASLILVNTTCEYSEDQIALWRERARQVVEEGIEPLHPVH